LSTRSGFGNIVPPQHARTRPGGAAVFASVLLHGAVAAVIIAMTFQQPHDLPEYKVYRVDIFSPPPLEQGEPQSAKPQPAVIKPPEKKSVAVEKKPTAPPKPAAKKSLSTSTSGKSDVAKGRNPDPKALVGGEGIDVHMAGDEFPYPAYLNNIILQLTRYMRWSGPANLEAKVGFEITRDGSVRNIHVLQRSGNFNFDLEAVSAIENAGKNRAFGPLPKGWVQSTLPIAYRFLPPGR